MVVTDGLHRVTGELTPDNTGDYLPHIIHNGKMSYRRQDGAWFIWRFDDLLWTITTQLGVQGANFWSRVDPEIQGNYDPGGGAVGIATVTEI